MAKRIKKPPVRPEVRKRWLKRYEEDGDSPPQIATTDGFDVRTVRKQIEKARQEREVRETRLLVLRDATERHYADICQFAEKLKAHVTGEDSISLFADELLWPVLKQHLSRSPLWNLLNRRGTLLERLFSARESLEKRLNIEVGADTMLGPILSECGTGVVSGMVKSLVFNVERGLDIETNFRVKPTKDGKFSIELGAFPFGDVNEERQAQTVKGVLVDWQDKVSSWVESGEMGRILAELQRVRLKLKDELNTITMRRIVPGRCKYCPT